VLWISSLLLLILKVVVSSEGEWWSYCTHCPSRELQDFQDSHYLILHSDSAYPAVGDVTLQLGKKSWNRKKKKVGNTNLVDVDEHLCLRANLMF